MIPDVLNSLRDTVVTELEAQMPAHGLGSGYGTLCIAPHWG